MLQYLKLNRNTLCVRRSLQIDESRCRTNEQRALKIFYCLRIIKTYIKHLLIMEEVFFIRHIIRSFESKTFIEKTFIVFKTTNSEYVQQHKAVQWSLGDHDIEPLRVPKIQNWYELGNVLIWKNYKNYIIDTYTRKSRRKTALCGACIKMTDR